MSFWDVIAERIACATGHGYTVRGHHAVGGGCISAAHVVSDGARRFFVKRNRAEYLPMFEAEAAGLAEIKASNTVRVPAPVCHGAIGADAYLVLEYLQLDGTRRGGAERLGQQLAELHRVHGERYGWRIDNTIGATPQINDAGADWPQFWRHRRLGYQLALAARNGYCGSLQRRGERLLDALPALLAGHAPPPSLLHGDLWSGNFACDDCGEPVVFDPAVYYGDRETDLAMTELFGGFPADFYAAYREAYPLAPEYRLRKTLYNLYHVLNHLNLFGGGYLSQAQAMIDRLLAECR